MGTIVRNKLPQAVPTLVHSGEGDKFTEVKIPPRAKFEIPDPISALTQSQLDNGILKVVAPKKG